MWTNDDSLWVSIPIAPYSLSKSDVRKAFHKLFGSVLNVVEYKENNHHSFKIQSGNYINRKEGEILINRKWIPFNSIPSHLLSIPCLNMTDYALCPYYNTNKQCIREHGDGYTLNQKTFCGQCRSIVMQLTVRNLMPLVQEKAASFMSGCQLILSENDMFRFYLQNRMIFNRTINTVVFLFKSLRESKIDNYYYYRLSETLQFMKTKKIMSWLVAANHGLHFKYLVIDGFNEYLKRGKLSRNPFNEKKKIVINIKSRSESYLFMYHIVTYLYSKRLYFTKKVNKIKANKYGVHVISRRIKLNYLWILDILNNYDLEFMFCPDLVKEQRMEFRKVLREKRVCDNRDCDRKKMLKWYICKRCKLVKYCSRRCQKKDWNLYQHRKICFIPSINY